MPALAPVLIKVQMGRQPIATAPRVPVWAEGGLAITRTLGKDGWTITHVASGYATFDAIRTQTTAKQIARRMLELGSWERSKTAMLRDGPFKRAVRALIATVKQEGLVS